MKGQEGSTKYTKYTKTEGNRDVGKRIERTRRNRARTRNRPLSCDDGPDYEYEHDYESEFVRFDSFVGNPFRPALFRVFRVFCGPFLLARLPPALTPTG